MKKILIVAAHPDDEILGCGGTVASMVEKGYEAYSLILGEGITSRNNEAESEIREDQIQDLKQQMLRANEVIGVKKVYNFDFPDNRFDSISLLDLIKKVEEIKSQIMPDIIFTHFKNDLNIDHRKTLEAVLTASRPMKEETVKTIYSFEVLSSTEWNYPTTFSPNVFFDISNYLDKKINAMKCYKNELRNYPHPRSIEMIRNNAIQWGSKVGQKYAEAFSLVRKISNF